MTVIAQPKTVTPEDLLAMRDGVDYELVRGELVERNMGWDSSWVAASLLILLGAFLRTHPFGRANGADASYQCYPDDPAKVRRPDVSFVRLGRLANEERPKGHSRIAPDMAAEVVSPNDQFSEVEAKVEDYLEASVRLVWVLDPPTRTVQIRRADGTIDRLRESDELDGEDVIPGFRCRVAEIFADPAAEAAKSAVRP